MESKQIEPRRWLRVQQWADRAGVSVWTARKKAYTGNVESSKVGSLLYIPEDEIDRLFAEGTRPRLARPGVA